MFTCGGEVKKKVLVFGASGIIGQSMRLCKPDGIQVIHYRRHANFLHRGIDLTNFPEVSITLDYEKPDVVINLAGENRTDVVEREPGRYQLLNVEAPAFLADWCDDHGAHYIHASSQAVFSGSNPPYSPDSPLDPINEYGKQKAAADSLVMKRRNWTIIRPSFVVGIRPLPHVGRKNPLEAMLDGSERKQVDDRWFTPNLAIETAAEFWRAINQPFPKIRDVGAPIRASRYDIAALVGVQTEPVGHSDFAGLAPRPSDTSWGDRSPNLLAGPLLAYSERFQDRQNLNLPERAREIALFLGVTEQEANWKLARGFSDLHNAVTDDFRRFGPRGDYELLCWYRETEAYIWELAAYHLDAGFNYSGQCQGIVTHLVHAGAKRVLCLGDGIGDLTLAVQGAGLEAVYHDLEGSRTAQFAEFVSWKRTGRVFPMACTRDWKPRLIGGPYDAIVSLDFLEHCPNVDAWIEAIRRNLKPGGLLASQNAFGMGSGPNGAMPMHLSCNDRFEKDWDPTLAKVGFKMLSSNWYERAA